MRTSSAIGIAAILLCGAVDARAEEFRETAALRLGVAQARTVHPNNAGLGHRFTVAAAVRPWKLLEIEGDLGIADKGGVPPVVGGVRAGLAYPFRTPATRFQLDGVLLAGYRALMGWDLSDRADDASDRPGLPGSALLHTAELIAALDATVWIAPETGLTMRLFGGVLVAPWAPYVGYAPEFGAAAGVAF